MFSKFLKFTQELSGIVPWTPLKRFDSNWEQKNLKVGQISKLVQLQDIQEFSMLVKKFNLLLIRRPLAGS